MTCLYVTEIGDDRIKVGQSCDPANRLKTHRAIAEAHGCTPGQQWTSCPARTDPNALERNLINFCAQRASRVFGLEYFTGVPFDNAVRYGEALTGGGTTEDLRRVRVEIDHVIPPEVARMRAAFDAAVEASPFDKFAFTSQMLAELFDQPVEWVDHLVETRAVKSFRIGRRIRIGSPAVKAWLDEQAAPNVEAAS